MLSKDQQGGKMIRQRERVGPVGRAPSIFSSALRVHFHEESRSAGKAEKKPPLSDECSPFKLVKYSSPYENAQRCACQTPLCISSTFLESFRSLHAWLRGEASEETVSCHIHVSGRSRSCSGLRRAENSQCIMHFARSKTWPRILCSSEEATW